MKTYFNYEGQINSKEAAEAIAFPVGIGPFMGFGSGKIQGDKVTLYPKAPTNTLTLSPYAKSINDRGLARNISLRGDNTIPTFGLVNRTGHLWVSTQSEVTIENIRGTQGAWDEVLVFAVFQDIESPIINTPTFVAYWNGSSQSFYEYWKKSTNPFYGGSTENSQEPWESEMSFTDLQSKVEAAVGVYKNSRTMVLIGIYGTGTDSETNNLEDFALVPYQGIFPQSVPFTLDYYYSLKRKLDDLKQFVREGLGGYSNVKEYVDKKLGELMDGEEAPGTIPIGGIILWSGETIPDGWAICNGSQGTPDLQSKFVMAAGGDYKLGQEGGFSEVALTSNNLPAHKHSFKDYYYPETGNKAKGNFDVLDINSGVGSNDTDYDNDHLMYYQHDTDSTGQTSPTPIPIIPPYYVLYYIMRIR